MQFVHIGDWLAVATVHAMTLSLKAMAVVTQVIARTARQPIASLAIENMLGVADFPCVSAAAGLLCCVDLIF